MMRVHNSHIKNSQASCCFLFGELSPLNVHESFTGIALQWAGTSLRHELQSQVRMAVIGFTITAIVFVTKA
jgi:hypothetical protein